MSFKHGATLNGAVNPNGLETSVSFSYGTVEGAANVVDAGIVLPGYEDVLVSVDVVDLLPETVYLFKVVATNALGTVAGEVLQFTTLINTDLPTAVTLGATNIS